MLKSERVFRTDVEEVRDVVVVAVDFELCQALVVLLLLRRHGLDPDPANLLGVELCTFEGLQLRLEEIDSPAFSLVAALGTLRPGYPEEKQHG